MSANPVQGAKPIDAWEANDEIDLRKYIDVLIKRWREIVFFTLLVIAASVLGVLAYRLLQTPVYEARASVAIVRTQTEVNFDERFTTSSGAPGAGDVNSRRSALLGLVYSGSIAERVVADLHDQLNERQRDPAYLLRQINAELSTPNNRTGQSDLILISARAESPLVAAAIANAWAQHYVQEVNRIYGQVPDEIIASVQKELNQAQENYAQAQRALEQFLAESPLNALRREMEETQQAIATLQNVNATALSSYADEILSSYRRIITAYLDAQTEAQLLGFQREQEGRRQLLDAYMLAYNSALVDAFDTQRQRDARLLRLYHDQWLQMTAALSTARLLQAGLQAGGEGAVTSTAAALQLLKTQLASSTISDIPSLQFALTSPSEVTLAALTADLNGTIEALEQQLAQLEADIDALTQALASGERFNGLEMQMPEESELVNAIRARYPTLFERGPFSELGETASRDARLASEGRAQAEELLKLAGAETAALTVQADAPMQESIALLESRLQKLQAQVEAEQAAYRRFTQQRDLAWDALKALSTKQAELRLERAAANTEVRMGTPAIAPDEPVQIASAPISIALAAVVGFMLAIFLAFLFEYLGRPPLFVRTSQAM
ncbi:MAG: Wzz/FepE/Etk N-terminal domain-containing protein [Caldilinea sp.]|uniref:Wzz/FepE/Etk N-terminal domain-containing protein n=1 Tax=Caldilinea sp. TaxID=2293560 RepID=UPI0030AB8996